MYNVYLNKNNQRRVKTLEKRLTKAKNTLTCVRQCIIFTN